MIGIPVARIGGIEVRVQPGWIIVVALVAVLGVGQMAATLPELGTVMHWLLGLVIGVGFFVSATVHDLSHGLVARRRGIEVPSLLISFFGGTTPMDPAADNPRDDLAIAVSGPLASAVLGIVLVAGAAALGPEAGGLTGAAAQVLAVLGALNVLLGVVNLLPSYPMDGGRIVRDLGWRRSGTASRGWMAAGSAGRFTGLLVMLGGGALAAYGQVANGLMVALCGWFLVLSSRTIRDRVRVEQLIGGLSVGEVMERDGPTVPSTLTVDTIAGQMDADSPVTAMAVVDGTTVVGVIGVSRLRRMRPAERAERRVADVMTGPPRMPVLAAEEDLVAATDRLLRSGLDGVPVMDGEALLGMLTKRSIGAAVARRRLGAAAGDPSGVDGAPSA